MLIIPRFLKPPIRESVGQLTPDRWVLGSSKICERIKINESTSSEAPSNDDIPACAIVTWHDDGYIFYLRERAESDLAALASERDFGAGWAAGDFIHSSVWNLSPGVFCKVSAWAEGTEVEGDTIGFVRTKFPSVPVPEVLSFWVDREWNRSYLVMKRVPGKMLHCVWPVLSADQRKDLGVEVARYCALMATLTSFRFESPTGLGVETYVFQKRGGGNPDPFWRPQILGPLSVSGFQEHLRKDREDLNYPLGDCFHFYHPDLGPGNVFVSHDGKVSGIIDWQGAGFFPRFWIATIPCYPGFSLDYESPEYGALTGPQEWTERLVYVLVDEGFRPAPHVTKPNVASKSG